MRDSKPSVLEMVRSKHLKISKMRSTNAMLCITDMACRWCDNITCKDREKDMTAQPTPTFWPRPCGAIKVAKFFRKEGLQSREDLGWKVLASARNFNSGIFDKIYPSSCYLYWYLYAQFHVRVALADSVRLYMNSKLKDPPGWWQALKKLD